MKCSFDPEHYAEGMAIGMFHCPECGEMVVAGLPHPDYERISEMESSVLSKYMCPKCETPSLIFKEDAEGWKAPDQYVCISCGDTWDAKEVRRYNFRHLQAEATMCEVCGEHEADVEFRMPVELPRDEVGLPVGFTMVRGMICLNCFDSTDDDETIARKIRTNQSYRLEEKEKKDGAAEDESGRRSDPE